MNWWKGALSIGAMLFLSIGLAACNTGENQYSPQEVVNAALQEAQKPISYYGEFTLVMNDEAGPMNAKEWASADGKRKVELVSEDGTEHSVAINDGKQLLTYDKASNTAMTFKLTEEDIQMLSQQSSPRQQAEKLLEMIKDSHEISIAGEETIAGRTTFHVIAKAQDDKTLIGDQELWIDKETWMVLKTVSKSNESILTQEYTKIDFNATFDEDVFVLDIPEDATVEAMDEDSYKPKEVTIDEAKEALGPFYQVPETEELKLAKITVLDSLEERPEFSFDYIKDGIPAFSVSVFKEQSNVTDFGAFPSEEEITIRGTKGTKIESGDFRLLNWGEEGLRYSAMPENPEISFEELEQYVENMELVD